jgi:hypothetical protein
MVFVPHVYQGTGTDDAFGWQLPDGNFSHRLDYRGRNRASNTPAGTVVVGAGAGTGASASLVAGSTDDIGTVQINSGTATLSNNTVATITFHDPFVTAPFVQLQARDLAGGSGVYFCTTSTTQLVIKTVNALTVSSTILVDYDCTGGQ